MSERKERGRERMEETEKGLLLSLDTFNIRFPDIMLVKRPT